MQLRKMMVMLAAVSTMSLALTACGDDATTAETCSSDTDCASGFCNTAASVCMETCESASDCPDTEKECAPLAGATNTAKVCQCKTNQLCNEDDSTSLVCGTVSKRCEEPGTATGCTTDAQCTGGNICDTATGQCKPAATTCSGEGKSTCAYGSYCASGTCTAVPAPVCDNFNPAKGGKQPVWTTASTGPIIYSITKSTWGADVVSPAFCSTGDTLRAEVKAYATAAGTFPAQKSALSGLFYVTVNGNQSDGTALIRPSGYTAAADGRSATFTMNFCPGAITTISLGLYFTNGNEICAQLNK